MIGGLVEIAVADRPGGSADGRLAVADQGGPAGLLEGQAGQVAGSVLPEAPAFRVEPVRFLAGPRGSEEPAEVPEGLGEPSPRRILPSGGDAGRLQGRDGASEYRDRLGGPALVG